LRLTVLTLWVGLGCFVRPILLHGEPPAPILVGAGDIASCGRDSGAATARLLDTINGTVFTAGDNVYQSGSAQEFIECYGLTWGRHRQRTRPSPGNHDYGTPEASAYFNYFGAKAGPPSRGYYSYDLEAWHIVSLNSNTDAKSWGAAQEKWLAEDLAANPARCKLAYWHHPRFSSAKNHGDQPHMASLFRILHRYGVSVAIAGHDHVYERFAPQNADGQADPKGVRQFIVGTGGAPLYRFAAIKALSEARNSSAHGVIKFTLHPKSYEWEFIPVAGQKFTDRGTAQCVPFENGKR